MTEEEYFRKNYPDSCYGDKPLSPYWDYFQSGVEFGERQSEKEIEELEAQLEQAKKIIHKVCYEFGVYNKDLMEEAKQFLNSEVVK